MPFWSTNFGEDPTLKDPKRKFRFTVEFQGVSAAIGGAVLWYAKTVAKPSFQIASSEHKYLNHTFYYPGSVTWQDVAVTLVDPVDPEMAATFSDIIVQGGYSPPTDTNDLSTMSKARPRLLWVQLLSHSSIQMVKLWRYGLFTTHSLQKSSMVIWSMVEMISLK